MFGNNLENESLQKKILIEKSSNQNILSYKKLQCYFKLIIISFSLIFLTRNLFLYFSQEEIEINNRMQFTKEEDIDFSGYSTTIKPIAIYLPETNSINDTNKNYIFEKIKSHINLAKNHGIFGFAFYYFLSDNSIDILRDTTQGQKYLASDNQLFLLHVLESRPCVHSGRGYSRHVFLRKTS